MNKLQRKLNSKPTWETYNGYIYELRQQGTTLQAIGDKVGRSRERIRQVLVEHYGSTDITQLLSTPELAKLVGVHTSTIYELQKRGIIKPANSNSGLRLWGIDSVKALLLSYGKCKMCGNSLPKKRISYCSPKCAELGHRKMWLRSAWRRLYKKKGQRIPPSIAYIRPKGSPYERKRLAEEGGRK